MLFRKSLTQFARLSWTVRNRPSTFSNAAHSPVVGYDVHSEVVHPPSLSKYLSSAAHCAGLQRDARYSAFFNRVVNSMRQNPMDWNTEEVVVVVLRLVHVRAEASADSPAFHTKLGPLFGAAIRIIEPRLDTVAPDLLCHLVWALSRPPWATRNRTFVNAAAAAVVPNISVVAQNALTKLIQGLASRPGAPVGVVAAAAAEVTGRLAAARPFTPAELSIVATAFAKVEVNVPDAANLSNTAAAPSAAVMAQCRGNVADVFPRIAATALLRLEDFRPREEATLVHALCKAVTQRMGVGSTGVVEGRARTGWGGTAAPLGGDASDGGSAGEGRGGGRVSAAPSLLKVVPVVEFLDAVCRRMARDQTWYNAHEYSNVVWSLGKAYSGGVYVIGVDREVEDVEGEDESVGGREGIQVHCTAGGVRGAHARLVEVVVGLLASRSVLEYNGLELAKALHGVAAVGAVGAGVIACTESVAVVGIERVASFSNVDVATIMLALSNLVAASCRAGDMGGAGEVDRGGAIGGGEAAEYDAQETAGEGVGVEVSDEVRRFYVAACDAVVSYIDDYRVHDLANVVAAVTRLGVATPSLLSAATQRAVAVIPSGRPEALSRLAWGFVRCGVTDERVYADLFQTSLLWLPHASPPELCNLAWAASRVEPAILSSIASTAMSKLNQFSGRNLVNLFASLRVEGQVTVPSSAVVHCFLVGAERIATQLDAGSISVSGACSLIESFVMVRPPNVLRVLTVLLRWLAAQPAARAQIGPVVERVVPVLGSGQASAEDAVLESSPHVSLCSPDDASTRYELERIVERVRSENC